jgi:uncharacterized protein
MRLYSGSTPDFVKSSARNQISEVLRASFRSHFGYEPPDSEVRSWRESLRAMSQVITEAKLDDHGVILEYQLPLTSKRLDCLFTGHATAHQAKGVVVELKQWDEVSIGDGDGLVRTFVGGNIRNVLHPCAQVNQYRRYLLDGHEVFHGPDAVGLEACAYLHNYHAQAGDAIFASCFDGFRSIAPLYTAGAVPELVEFLRKNLSCGRGMPILERVENSRYRPSKRLLEHVNGVIRNEPRFVLLDEQQVVFQRVLAQVREKLDKGQKHVFLVRGGPGTGKSVLAINLLSEISRLGLNAQYATGSRAFTKTLQKIVGARAAAQFKYFNNYGGAEPGVVDVLICDESHRIRASSNHRFTKPAQRSTRAQIRELLDASRVSVFLIDDLQVVRPGEVGSSNLIREAAKDLKCDVEEHELEAQFRCHGSAALINWIDNTLGTRNTANAIWDQSQESFELKILDSPELLDAEIRSKANEDANARLVAGFCWPWSKEPDETGQLIADVCIGNFARPWNAHPEANRRSTTAPVSDLWAYDARGIDQIGCIYTAQGFEFDYVGVIWGTDLRYDPDAGAWIGDRTKSCDSVVKRSGEQFVELIKNTYRTLLTRGMKACYICFLDKETERFVRSRTKNLGALPVHAPVDHPAPLGEVHLEDPLRSEPFKRLRPDQIQRYKNSVPLVDLKFAAGAFSSTQAIDPDEVEWVELPSLFRPQLGLFVAQVIGQSMNRRIPDGAWCLFRLNPTGTRHGKVVVAQHRAITDADFGGSFTVKVYRSEKRESADDQWTHSSILLCPDSDDPTFQPIVLDEKSSLELFVVAELVTVLSRE